MKRLCHYTTAKNAVSILGTRSFKFSQIRNSNDPFENLIKRYNLTYQIQGPLKSFMDNLFNFSNNEISIACFGYDKQDVPADQNWTMWAHYGSKHSGVCFIFDFEKLIAEIDSEAHNPLHDKIQYTNNLLISPHHFENHISKKIQDVIIEFSKQLLFSKHIGWSIENEYRIVVFKKSLTVSIVDSLKQVLFGPEISYWYQSRLENLLSNFGTNIKFGKLTYSGSSYARPLKFVFDDLYEIF